LTLPSPAVLAKVATLVGAGAPMKKIESVIAAA